MQRNLDPFTAFQVEELQKRTRVKIARNRDAIFRMKGTRTQIEASIKNTSDAFYLRFMRTWRVEYSKSIDKLRLENRRLQQEIR